MDTLSNSTEIASLKQLFDDRLGASILLELANNFGPLQVLREVLVICAGVHAAEVVKMDPLSDSSNAQRLLREDHQLHDDISDGFHRVHVW